MTGEGNHRIHEIHRNSYPGEVNHKWGLISTNGGQKRSALVANTNFVVSFVASFVGAGQCPVAHWKPFIVFNLVVDWGDFLSIPVSMLGFFCHTYLLKKGEDKTDGFMFLQIVLLT